MIMVGDMFNQGLKHRVDTLCNELAGLLRDQQLLKVNAASFQSQSQSGGGGVSLFVPGSRASSSQWWPEELGIAASTGTQNDFRYACFPSSTVLRSNRAVGSASMTPESTGSWASPSSRAAINH